MEVKKPKIKSIAYEEFNDNEYLENMVKELNANGTNVVMGVLDDVINWGRSNSLWPLTFATSCCGIEYMAVGAARYDFARFGFEVTRASPRQADFIMVAGTITDKMAPVLKRLYDQMADPKYVIAIGACAVSGGPFKKSYHVVNGVDKVLPVDVYVPGCPPRPEAMLYGIIQLQRKVKLEKFFGDVNKQVKNEEYERLLKEQEQLERAFLEKHYHGRESMETITIPTSREQQNPAYKNPEPTAAPQVLPMPEGINPETPELPDEQQSISSNETDHK